jgi:hypothetical protein
MRETHKLQLENEQKREITHKQDITKDPFRRTSQRPIFEELTNLEMVMEEKSEKGIAYLSERRPRFQDTVLLGFLRTETLARQNDDLGLRQALGLR